MKHTPKVKFVCKVLNMTKTEEWDRVLLGSYMIRRLFPGARQISANAVLLKRVNKT